MSKPLGLKIIAWIFIIVGIFGVIVLPAVTFIPEAAKEVGKPQLFFDVTTSILGVIFGIGLLKLKKWAWFGGIIVAAIEIISVLISIPTILNTLNKELGLHGIAMDGIAMAGILLSLLIPGLIIAYLMRRNIRQLFQITT